jgi:Signal peptidase, peptidase S26
MGSLARFVLGVVLTVGALAAVLLGLVFEARMAPEGESPTVHLLDRGRRLRVGDLAVCTHRGGEVVARVAASANQRLALRGNLLFVDNEPVERRPCRPQELEARAIAPSRCFVERRGDRSWTVLAPAGGRTVDLEVTVPAGQVYVLDDDRASIENDSRRLGPFARESCRPVAAKVSAGSFRWRP